LVGDDEEEDDNVLLESDVDDQDDLSEEHEDVEDIHGQRKKLIVKLPVKTPTPERKPLIKPRLSPEKVLPKGDGLFSAPADSPNRTGVSTSALSATSSSPEIKEKTEMGLHQTVPSDPLELSSKPLNIKQKSPSRQVPHSPLAFRGSPEKPPTLPPSIDVGYGKS
jgi:hypothetical protein